MQLYNSECLYSKRRSFSADGIALRHAYSLQYVSFVLIVLTFVIGAFLRGPIAYSFKNVTEESPPLAQLIYSTDFKDLFEKDKAWLNHSKIDALISLLQNHDLDLEVDLFLGKDAAEQNFKLALQRAHTLFMALTQAGVPAEAVRVYAIDTLSDTQAQIRVFRTVSYEH